MEAGARMTSGATHVKMIATALGMDHATNIRVLVFALTATLG